MDNLITVILTASFGGIILTGAYLLFSFIREDRERQNVSNKEVTSSMIEEESSNEAVQTERVDLSQFTKAELVEYAKENNIKVSTRSKKAEILDTILRSI